MEAHKMEQNASGFAVFLASFVPYVLISIVLGFMSRSLAKEKGRNIALWTVLGFIPFVNFFSWGYFIGAANIRLENKVDQLLAKSAENN